MVGGRAVCADAAYNRTLPDGVQVALDWKQGATLGPATNSVHRRGPTPGLPLLPQRGLRLPRHNDMGDMEDEVMQMAAYGYSSLRAYHDGGPEPWYARGFCV